MSKIFYIMLFISGITVQAQDILNRNFCFGSEINVKYGYAVPYLAYNAQRILWNETTRFQVELKGYRITKYVITEYSRLSIGFDKQITKERLDFLPKAGLAISYDFYDGYKTNLGLAVQPYIGCDIYKILNKHSLKLKNKIIIYKDGFWYEITPGYYYQALNKFQIGVHCDVAAALVYSGFFDIGLYPGLQVNFCF